jgi:hypothetical protein
MRECRIRQLEYIFYIYIFDKKKNKEIFISMSHSFKAQFQN